MKKSVKVSILVPIYNVEKYLAECLASLINQTLQDIEIICINDGSTDNSEKIMRHFASKDDRIIMLNKKNSGYGDSMNKGLAKATGEYIGILESDDFIEPGAFEGLYRLAKEYDADVARSNYYQFFNGKNRKVTPVDSSEVGRLINPRADNSLIIFQAPAIWSSIYKRSFLEENGIQFLPTPGASYQDTSFNFKVWALAKRAAFTNNAYLHYRMDNESSSINSPGKVFCVNEEYSEIERFMKAKGLYDELEDVINYAKLGSYLWNIDRLSSEKLAISFINRMKEEYQDVTLDIPLMSKEQEKALFTITNRPAKVYYRQCARRRRRQKVHDILSSLNMKIRPAYQRQTYIIDTMDEISEKHALLAEQVQFMLDDYIGYEYKTTKEK